MFMYIGNSSPVHGGSAGLLWCNDAQISTTVTNVHVRGVVRLNNDAETVTINVDF